MAKVSLGLLSKKTPAAQDPIPAVQAAAPPAPAAPAGKAIPAWQKGKRAVTVWIDEEQYERLNEASFKHRKPVRRLVFEALNMILPVYDKLPVEDRERLERKSSRGK